MADKVMAYTVTSYIVMACIVMPCILVADIVMAYRVVAQFDCGAVPGVPIGGGREVEEGQGRGGSGHTRLKQFDLIHRLYIGIADGMFIARVWRRSF